MPVIRIHKKSCRPPGTAPRISSIPWALGTMWSFLGHPPVLGLVANHTQWSWCQDTCFATMWCHLLVSTLVEGSCDSHGDCLVLAPTPLKKPSSQDPSTLDPNKTHKHTLVKKERLHSKESTTRPHEQVSKRAWENQHTQNSNAQRPLASSLLTQTVTNQQTPTTQTAAATICSKILQTKLDPTRKILAQVMHSVVRSNTLHALEDPPKFHVFANYNSPVRKWTP